MTGALRPSWSRAVFAERPGFVLLDPARLEVAARAVATAGAVGPTTAPDLLQLVLETELGAHLARAGIAVPASGIQAGSYDLVVHSSDDPVIGDRPLVASGGWVLSTEGGLLLLGPLGLLRDWDRYDLRWRWVTVPPGHYAVEVQGFARTEPPTPEVEGTYAWVLRTTPAPAWFSADLEG